MTTTQHAKLGEVDFAWEEQGEGPDALVLVHGFSGCRHDFSGVTDGISDLGRTISVDLPGHGESTKTSRPEDYLLDRLTIDLVGFLESFVGVPCDLLGHDIGGMVCLRVALTRPDLLRSIILTGTAPDLDPSMGTDGLSAAMDLVWADGMEGLLPILSALTSFGAAEQPLIDRQLGPAESRAHLERGLLSMAPVAFVATVDGLSTLPSVTDRLHELDLPTTVIVGNLDETMLDGSLALAEQIAHARLAVIEGAYHNPHLTHTREWTAAVRRHLANART